MVPTSFNGGETPQAPTTTTTTVEGETPQAPTTTTVPAARNIKLGSAHRDHPDVQTPATTTARTALTSRTVLVDNILRPGNRAKRWHRDLRLCQRQEHATIWHHLPVPCLTITAPRLRGKSRIVIARLRLPRYGSRPSPTLPRQQRSARQPTTPAHTTIECNARTWPDAIRVST